MRPNANFITVREKSFLEEFEEEEALADRWLFPVDGDAHDCVLVNRRDVQKFLAYEKLRENL